MALMIGIGLWYAGPILQSVAAYRLYRNGLIERLAALWIYLLVSAFTEAGLLYLHNVGSTGYGDFYAYSMPILVLLQAMAAVGVFWAMAEKYPQFRKPGSALLAALAIIGATATYATRFLGVPGSWHALWQTEVLLQRYSSMIVVVVMFASRLLFTQIEDGIPVRPTAVRAADILSLHALVAFLGTAFTVATHAKYPVVAGLLPLSNSFLLAALCAFWLPLASNECRDVKPMTPEEIARIKREWTAIMQLRIGRSREVAGN